MYRADHFNVESAVTNSKGLKMYPPSDFYIVSEKRQYIVSVGDTIFSIARRIFGSESLAYTNWHVICELNRCEHLDDLLIPGKVINLPVTIHRLPKERPTIFVQDKKGRLIR